MQPAMSDAERNLLHSFLYCSWSYLEFGTGGSTALACSLVRKSVISVESDPEWLKKVDDYCSSQATVLKPELIYADIGPVRDLGYPQGDGFRDRWPNYHDRVWLHEGANNADLYLIDGRFRVACFIQTLLHAQSSAIIVIHDFVNRPHYHVVREFSHEIAIAGSLSIFQRKGDFDRRRAELCLADHRFDPN
jgi:hypothetical protein